MSRVRCCLAGLLLGAIAGGAQARAEPPRALRYVTYNVLHGGAFSGVTGKDDDLEERLRLAVEGLRDLDADLIGVQEASWTRRRGRVAARLARALGYHHADATALFNFTPVGWLNRSIAWLLNFSEGPAVLSRFPIVAWETYELPRCAGAFDPRVLIYTTVRTPWGDLGVASTHTSWGACETERIVELMRAHRGPLPSVLLGDFNAEEDSPAIRTLTERGGLVDVFRAANPSAPGFTVYQPVRAPEARARRRVDFVFMLAGERFPGRIRSSRVVLDTPSRRDDASILWPSDHYGVLAELEVIPAEQDTAGVDRPPPEGAGGPE